VTVEIPDEIGNALGNTPEETRRRVLECMVVEAYKNRKVSRGQVRAALGLSWQGAEEFLARNGATYHYGVEELDEDIETGRRLLNLSESNRR
jgi:predicted HTH domain antitoxin